VRLTLLPERFDRFDWLLGVKLDVDDCEKDSERDRASLFAIAAVLFRSAIAAGEFLSSPCHQCVMPRRMTRPPLNSIVPLSHTIAIENVTAANAMSGNTAKIPMSKVTIP
jgi:hypothetical protein